MTGWVWLLLAGVSEAASVPLLKKSQGLRRFRPAAAAVLAIAISFYGLTRSLSSVPVGTAYAVWTGIGSCAAIVAGIVLYGESVRPAKLIYAALVVTGILGLKLSG